MADFFVDSTASVEGLPLSSVTAFSNTTYTFTICMPETVGNEYQKTNLVFDLAFGITKPPIEVPEVCAPLYGIITNVIHGTEGNDRIHATTKPDLIYA